VTKKIIEEWKQVDRMKQLNQRLYDELDVALMFILEYAERNNFVLPNSDRLFRMVENIHNTTNAINEYHGKINNNNSLQTESQQRKETPDKDNNTIIIIMDQDFFLISANFMAIQCMLLFTSETQPRFIFIRCFASRYYLSNDMQRISNRMILATKKHPVY
jgi:uncharacterized membrane-anchored protein